VFVSIASHWGIQNPYLADFSYSSLINDSVYVMYYQVGMPVVGIVLPTDHFWAA
jgi:hypothetical protein